MADSESRLEMSSVRLVQLGQRGPRPIDLEEMLLNPHTQCGEGRDPGRN